MREIVSSFYQQFTPLSAGEIGDATRRKTRRRRILGSQNTNILYRFICLLVNVVTKLYVLRIKEGRGALLWIKFV